MTYTVWSVRTKMPVRRWDGPPHERVLVRVTQEPNGCWYFHGCIDANGYGDVCNQTGSCLAHRIVYESLVGPVPAGLVLDHLCRTPRCVNPSHLEPVSQGENVRRALMKAVCKRGHLIERRGRDKYGACIECVRVRSEERRRRRGVMPRQPKEASA